MRALEQYDLKEEHAGRYRANSPLRPGSNSHGFTLTIDDDEHGAYFDHVSGQKGSLYQLAEALCIERSARASDSSKGRTYESLADYAGERYEAAFIAAGWSPDVQLVYDNQERGKRPALVFGNANGKRARFVDGLRPSYKPLPKEDTTPCWYGLRSAAQMGGDPVLCNGESSAITGQVHGVPAICISGSGEGNIATNLHKHRLLDELLQVYPPGTRITVALDCDQRGRSAAAAVVPLLASAGYNVQAIDLGLGGDGDLRDFCRLNEDDSIARLARCESLMSDDLAASEPQRLRFTLETLDDLANLPPTAWLIPDRIPADSLTLLYGPSESGKSFIALHWALLVALRNPDRAVVYVAPEGGSGYHQRAAAWLAHYQKHAPGNLFFIRSAPRMGDKHDLQALIEEIAPYNPVFVVLDTLARCAVELDENSAKDMGLFIEACDAIRRATGAAVMPVHHTGKAASNGARGSSALRAAVDMAHEVTRDDDQVILSCDKSKDIAKPEPIYLRMVESLDSVVLLPSDRVIRTSDKLNRNERAVLEALALEVFEAAGAKARQLIEVAQVPEGTVYRILSSLKRRGYLDQAAKGDPYTITDRGRKAITDHQSTIDSADGWLPDDDPPPTSPPPPDRRDSGDSDSDSSEPELSPEYGTTKPNYHTITSPDSRSVIVPGETKSPLSPNYHEDTASERPTITSITDYHGTIDSAASPLSSSSLSIFDSDDSDGAEDDDPNTATVQAPPVTDDERPAHDLVLLDQARDAEHRRVVQAAIDTAREMWAVMGAAAGQGHLRRALLCGPDGLPGGVLNEWIEAEKTEVQRE